MTDDNVDSDAADSSTDSEYGFGPAVADTAASTSAPRIRAKRGGRGSLRRKLTSIAILVGALTAVGGGYALLAPSSGAADTAVSAADVEKGRQLYETSCITCHGANLQGVADRGPSLIGVGSASAYFQVSTGRMPAVSQGANNLRKDPKFTEDQTQWIAAYVQSVGGGVQVPAGNLRADDADLAEGGELFRLNCASCHGATAKGAPLSAGKTAPGLNEATDSQMYAAMLSGPGQMPVFSDNQVTPDQKKAIIAYVQSMKAQKDPGGASLDRVGPVTEGLVVGTVGLGLLMVTILWIGRKS
ncbi:MAG: cytochrome c [Frankiales bacterium]|nr:cytochrome c [Frankiales bacterium]